MCACSTLQKWTGKCGPRLCGHICMYLLATAGCHYGCLRIPSLCEHVYVTMAVCVSWIWWRRPCVTPCGYVIESVNILEREQRVVVFVCQHYSFLQLSGSGWVTLSLLSVCSCDSILGKQHRWDRIFSCAFCANACNESSFPLLLSSTLSSGNV